MTQVFILSRVVKSSLPLVATGYLQHKVKMDISRHGKSSTLRAGALVHSSI